MSEEHIQQWRGYVQRRSVLASEDIAELEEHLRSQVDDLRPSDSRTTRRFWSRSNEWDASTTCRVNTPGALRPAVEATGHRVGRHR